jgi:type I restriction enzyme M protein
MRRKMIEADLVDCVIALGKNLFYNSTMESCLLITSNNKQAERKNKVIFIDARNELKDEKTISYLMPEHIEKIYRTYANFSIIPGFSNIASISEILEKDASLNVPLYVKKDDEVHVTPREAFTSWVEVSSDLKNKMNKLFEVFQ